MAFVVARLNATVFGLVAVIRVVWSVLGKGRQVLRPLRDPTGINPLATKGEFLREFRMSGL